MCTYGKDERDLSPHLPHLPLFPPAQVSHYEKIQPKKSQGVRVPLTRLVVCFDSTFSSLLSSHDSICESSARRFRNIKDGDKEARADDDDEDEAKPDRML